MGMRSAGLSKTFLLTDAGKKKKRDGERRGLQRSDTCGSHGQTINTDNYFTLLEVVIPWAKSRYR